MVYEPSVPPPKTLIGRITSHPIWMALSADIFTGQIIASLIVLTFVAVFLLREWISQNARPGVFEDEEVFPDMPPAANDPPPPPAPNPPVVPHIPALPDPAELELRQQNAMRALELLRAVEALRDQDKGDDQVQQKPHEDGNGEVTTNSIKPEKKKKRVQRADSGTEEDSDEVGVDRVKRKTHAHRIPPGGRSVAIRRRAGKNPRWSPSPPRRPLDAENPDSVCPFTFQASPSDSTNGTASTSDKVPHSTPEPLSSSPFARRPPLPTSVFAFPGPESAMLFPQSGTPLDSPSLATYRAPEELNAEAGPSKSREPFGIPHDTGQTDYDDTEGTQPQGFSPIPSPDVLNGEAYPERISDAYFSPHTAGTSGGAKTKDQIAPFQTNDSQPSGRDHISDRLDPSIGQLGDSSGTSAPVSVEDDMEPDFNPEVEYRQYFREADDTAPMRPSTPRPGVPEPVEPQDHEREMELRRDDDEEEEEELDEDVDELLWDNANWDGIEVEVEEMPDGPEQNVEGPAPAREAGPAQADGRGEANAAGDGALPPDLADDLEGNVEDDMEGAMEGSSCTLLFQICY